MDRAKDKVWKSRCSFSDLQSFVRFVKSLNLFRNQGPVRTKELARLGGMAYLCEMIFITSSNEIFYLIPVKKFVISLEKN